MGKFIKEEKEICVMTVGIIIALMPVMLLIVFVDCGKHKRERAMWGEGYHACGGEWRFINASTTYIRNRGTVTSYFFECDKCGYIQEFHYNPRS